MLKYPKITAEEADRVVNDKRYVILEEGIYRFTIEKVDEKVSKEGNPYYNYQLIVNHKGKRVIVFDKLILTEGWAWKIRHFCESINRINEYDNDTFDGGNANDTGILSVKIKEYKGEKQNEVYDYLTIKKVEEKKLHIKNDGESNEDKPFNSETDFNDEIPF